MNAPLNRCFWANGDGLYIAYHDHEWGVPVHDDRRLFEMLILEGAQAGLSWITILKKRENYRRAFDNFDARKIARYDARRIQRLLADPGIVRNRLKINAAGQNAKAFLAVQKEFGSFDKYIWQFVGGKPILNSWHRGQIPARTKRIRRHEQGPAQAWIQICRFNDLLRVHASCRHGERPYGGLFFAQENAVAPWTHLEMRNTRNKVIRIFATALILASVAPGCVSGKKSSDQSPSSAAFDKAASEFHRKIGDAEWKKLQTRLQSVNQDIVSHGILTVSNYPQPLETGYAYHQFYDWDLYFENLYLSYNGIPDFCFNNFGAFMSLQKPDGFIQRAFGTKPFGLHQPFKPFLAQIAVLGSRQRGDNYEWLRSKYYDQLAKYIDRWFAYDADSNGLPVWDSADASGMDNQLRRSGRPGSFFNEGVDLACYLHRELQAMACIAGKLGNTNDQKTYLARADALAKKMNAVFWDDKEGFYFDRNEKTGELNHLKSAAGFLPMWAGIASAEQARRLVTEHLLNTNEFWLTYPVATYARTEKDFYEGRRRGGGCNWQGPVWVPINYMIFHGLIRYGFKDAARDLAYRTFAMALDENPVTREFYDSDSGKGNGMDPFWGWSTLAYVMPLEFESGYDPMDFNGNIQPALATDLKIPWPRSVSP